MAANLATKEEFIVGWGFHPNKNTSALNVAETRMNSAFAGGGATTSKPERLSAHDTTTCHAELVSASP